MLSSSPTSLLLSTALLPLDAAANPASGSGIPAVTGFADLLKSLPAQAAEAAPKVASVPGTASDALPEAAPADTNARAALKSKLSDWAVRNGFARSAANIVNAATQSGKILPAGLPDAEGVTPADALMDTVTAAPVTLSPETLPGLPAAVVAVEPKLQVPADQASPAPAAAETAKATPQPATVATPSGPSAPALPVNTAAPEQPGEAGKQTPAITLAVRTPGQPDALAKAVTLPVVPAAPAETADGAPPAQVAERPAAPLVAPAALRAPASASTQAQIPTQPSAATASEETTGEPSVAHARPAAAADAAARPDAAPLAAHARVAARLAAHKETGSTPTAAKAELATSGAAVVTRTDPAPLTTSAPSSAPALATAEAAPAILPKTLRVVEPVRAEGPAAQGVPSPTPAGHGEAVTAQGHTPVQTAPTAPGPTSADINAALDRLIAAREALMPAETALSVEHAEFGEVTIRIQQRSDGRLSAEVNGADPELQRAVNAAVAADRNMSSGPESDSSRSNAQAQARGTLASGDGASGERGQRGQERELNDRRTPGHSRGEPGQPNSGSGVFA